MSMKVRIKRKIRVPHIVTVILCISPLIDVFTGFCKLNGFVAGDFLSVIYKMIISVLCIIICINHSGEGEWKLYGIALLWICISILWHIKKTPSIHMLMAEVNQYVKLFFPIIIYIALEKMLEIHVIDKKHIFDIFNFYLLFIPFSIIIPKLLGIGYHTYAGMESGYKGFYYGGNGINILTISMMFISGELFLNHKKEGKYLLVMILNIITVILIGTKTSILSFIFFCCILFMFLAKEKRSKITVFALAFILGVGVILFLAQNKQFMLGIYERLLWEYKRVDGKLVDFLTNSRIKQGIPYIQQVITKGSIFLNFILGIGYTEFQKVVEMDFLDIGLHYGFLVLIGIIEFYFKCYKKCKSRYKRYVFIFEMCYACFAGHLLISPMGSMIFAIYLLTGKRDRGVIENGEFKKIYCNI